MNIGTGGAEYYNSVLEITVSYLGIHKWEPDIYIGFSPALHLQCMGDYIFICRIYLQEMNEGIRT